MTNPHIFTLLLEVSKHLAYQKKPPHIRTHIWWYATPSQLMQLLYTNNKKILKKKRRERHSSISTKRQFAEAIDLSKD